MSFKVPSGHIAVNDKWSGTELFTYLNRSVKVIGLDSMGNVDFYLPDDIGIVYVTEAEQVDGSDCKKKIVDFQKVNFRHRLVFVDKTHVTVPYFYELQQFIVSEMGFGVLPVAGPSECAKYLAYVVHLESRDKPTVFKESPRAPPSQVHTLNILCKVPSLGKRKALAIMDNFENLCAVADAGVEDLEKVVGPSSAIQVYNYFRHL